MFLIISKQEPEKKKKNADTQLFYQYYEEYNCLNYLYILESEKMAWNFV